MYDTRGGLSDGRVRAYFDGSGDRGDLSLLCRDLVARQVDSWPECREGYELLSRVKVRDIPCSGFSVRVQLNPGRMRSTVAEVGREEVSLRPCFLCLPNLPEEQKGILYRNDYLILCNPMPVFASHFTVAHLRHTPQAMKGHISAYLGLMADLGNGWTVLYNGPGCGASAPDHLHFQVIPSGLMPIEKETVQDQGDPSRDGRVRMNLLKNMGRAVVLLSGADADTMERAFDRLLVSLGSAFRGSDEPMINAAGYHDGGRFRIMVFPRAKHRPTAFFRQGDDRLVVSPAVVEMGGIIVTPVERDFYRLSREDVEGIYREVSADGQVVEKALEVCYKDPIFMTSGGR